MRSAGSRSGSPSTSRRRRTSPQTHPSRIRSQQAVRPAHRAVGEADTARPGLPYYRPGPRSDVREESRREHRSPVLLLDGTSCGEMLAPVEKQARRAGRSSAGRHPPLVHLDSPHFGRRGCCFRAGGRNYSRPGAEPELVVAVVPAALRFRVLRLAGDLRRGARGRADRDLDPRPTEPAPALASVGYPPVWATIHNVEFAPLLGACKGGYLSLVTAIPLLVAIALARRAGCLQRDS
jgi:hypothetical protein